MPSSFLQACGETGGFFGHFAGRAVEIERVADDDVARAMLPRDFAQAWNTSRRFLRSRIPAGRAVMRSSSEIARPMRRRP